MGAVRAVKTNARPRTDPGTRSAQRTGKHHRPTTLEFIATTAALCANWLRFFSPVDRPRIELNASKNQMRLARMETGDTRQATAAAAATTTTATTADRGEP